MTKTFNFYTKNSSNNNSGIFLGKHDQSNYSEIIDNIIAADVIKKNKYLFTYDIPHTTPIILSGSTLKASDAFTKAAAFLANYKKKKKYTLPFILNELYTLSDGTMIIFREDEIQIDFDVYKYSEFSNISFLNKLTNPKKKIIIDIYTTGTANININL